MYGGMWNPYRLRLVLLVAIAAIVLDVASVAALGSNRIRHPTQALSSALRRPAMGLAVPTVVDVTLTDMPGAMIGPGMGAGMTGRGWAKGLPQPPLTITGGGARA
jgi:hypothetical protein